MCTVVWNSVGFDYALIRYWFGICFVLMFLDVLVR